MSIVKRRTPKNGIPSEFPSNADGDSATSIAIAQAIFDQIQSEATVGTRLARQISGGKFEQITRSFVETTFSKLGSLRPGRWNFTSGKRAIFRSEQYYRLAELERRRAKCRNRAVLTGSYYVIAPDVLVLREPEPDDIINRNQVLVDETVGLRARIREHNNKLPILHASISCKWKVPNNKSEALNLLSNTKGRVPHIAVVTGEPLPSRLASLALGTGDIDCVYHFAFTRTH